MKNLIAFFILIFGITVSLNAQVEKTLVKSVALKASNTAVVDLPGTVEVTTWDNDFIRVTTHLMVKNMNENITKQLIVVGRYTLATELNAAEQTLTITMPKIVSRVTVKGVLLLEELAFEIMAPEHYEVIIKKGEELDNVVSGETL